jgi:predicted PurR-regulated permease PerM
MVYSDLVSTRNKNISLYECRSNVRTTLTKQPHVSNNEQNYILSYAQAVPGLPTDATSNNNNSADITTQLTTFLNEFKNIFSRLLKQNSMILSMLTTVTNKLAQ